jgi:hypothetical protein
MTTTETAYIRNLFALAELLASNKAIPIPYNLSARGGLVFYVHGDIETVVAIRDLMDDPITLPNDSTTFPVQITGTLVGFATIVDVARDIAFDPREGYIVPAPAMNPRLLAESVSA